MKEKLPISFITEFISKGWDTVGEFKEDIKAINQTFSDTKKVEDYLQDLIDAYLICIGQMEAYLDKKDYIEYPEEIGQEMKKLDGADEQAETIPEQEKKPVEEPVVPEATDFTIRKEVEPKSQFFKSEPAPVVARDNGTPFEYFVDFEEPDFTDKKLTDDDIYGKQNIK